MFSTFRPVTWLDLAEIASVEISSEDAQHPSRMRSQAGQVVAGGQPIPGPQVIRLNFDRPQSIRRIRLEFREERNRAVAGVCRVRELLRDDQRREVVRQQWGFSPGGSAVEVEDYSVDLPAVLSLELEIDPGAP